MVYSFELIKHANIRYRDSLVVLSRCELFAMLFRLGISAEIREESMGGSRFLTIECRELSESEIAFLSGHSSFVFMAEKTNGLLRPLPVPESGYLPEDLPEDSPLLKKINETGKPVDKKYIIVAGERRYHAWMLNRKLEQEKIDKSGFSRENPFDTITANILTAEEAKHEEIYYSDSNTEARQLTPVEGMLNVKDALDTIRTNEEKRDAL